MSDTTESEEWHYDGPRCADCKGVYHEATGHRISATMVWCGPCTRRFIRYLKQRTSRRWGVARGYAFAEVLPSRDDQWLLPEGSGVLDADVVASELASEADRDEARADYDV